MLSKEYLLKKILSSGVSKEDLLSEIKVKKDNSNNSLSEEDILYLIARRLGIEIEPEGFPISVSIKDLKEIIDLDELLVMISELKEGAQNLVILGKIKKIFDSHTFEKKDGTIGNVGSIVIWDGSGFVKAVFWNDSVKFMKDCLFQENQIIRLIGVYCVKGKNNDLEVHLNNRSLVELAPKDVKESFLKTLGRPLDFIKIKEITLHKSTNISGRIINISPIFAYKKKDGNQGHFRKIKVKDDSGKIQINFWNGQIALTSSFLEGDKIDFENIFASFNTFKKILEINYNFLANFFVYSSFNEYISIEKLKFNVGRVFKKIKGLIFDIVEFKELNNKSGKATFFVKFCVKDISDALICFLWGSKAIDFMRGFNKNDSIEMYDVVVAKNKKSGIIEAFLHNKTIFKKLEM